MKIGDSVRMPYGVGVGQRRFALVDLIDGSYVRVKVTYCRGTKLIWFAAKDLVLTSEFRKQREAERRPVHRRYQ